MIFTIFQKISEKNALLKCNDLNKMTEILIETSEILLIKDYKSSLDKQIDKRIWLLFKLDIEKRMKIEVLHENSELFENKMSFVNRMIKKFHEVRVLF